MSLMVELDKRLSWIKTAYIGVDRDFILGYSNKIALIEGLFEYDTYKHKKRVHILKEDIDRFLVEGLKFSSKDDPRFIKLVNRVYGMYKGINDRERSLLIDRLYRYYSNTLSNSKDFVFNPFDKKAYPDVMSMIHGLDSILRRMDVKQGNIEVMNPDKSDIPLVYKDENRGIEVYRADNMFQAIKIGRGSGFCTTADCLDDRSVDNMYLGYKYSNIRNDLTNLFGFDNYELINWDKINDYIEENVELLGKQRAAMYFVITRDQMYNVDVYIDGGYLVTGSDNNKDIKFNSYDIISGTFPIFRYIPEDVFKFVETPITLQELRYSHGYAAFIDDKLYFSDDVFATLLGYDYNFMVTNYRDLIDQIKPIDLILLDNSGTNELVKRYRNELDKASSNQLFKLYINKPNTMLGLYPQGLNKIELGAYIPILFQSSSDDKQLIFNISGDRIINESDDELFVLIFFLLHDFDFSSNKKFINRVVKLRDKIVAFNKEYRNRYFEYTYNGFKYQYLANLISIFDNNPYLVKYFMDQLSEIDGLNWDILPINTKDEFFEIINYVSKVLDKKYYGDKAKWLSVNSISSLFKKSKELNLGNEGEEFIYKMVISKIPNSVWIMPDYDEIVKKPFLWDYTYGVSNPAYALNLFYEHTDLIEQFGGKFIKTIDIANKDTQGNYSDKVFNLYYNSSGIALKVYPDGVRGIYDRGLQLLHNKFPDNEVIKNEIEKRGLGDK